eukprot:Gb_06469 [translate_table: standard]
MDDETDGSNMPSFTSTTFDAKGEAQCLVEIDDKLGHVKDRRRQHERTTGFPQKKRKHGQQFKVFKITLNFFSLKVLINLIIFHSCKSYIEFEIKLSYSKIFEVHRILKHFGGASIEYTKHGSSMEAFLVMHVYGYKKLSIIRVHIRSKSGWWGFKKEDNDIKGRSSQECEETSMDVKKHARYDKKGALRNDFHGKDERDDGFKNDTVEEGGKRQNFQEEALDEECTVQPVPLENDRWGEPINEASNEHDRNEEPRKLQRYDTYAGDNRKDGDAFENE